MASHSNLIQTHLVTSGVLQNPFVAGSVLKCAADTGDVNLTLLVFGCIHTPDTFCINTVIKAYCLSNKPDEGLVFYFHRQRDGFNPDSYTFPPLISSCGKVGSLSLGQKCHGQVVKYGVDSVLPVGNSLMHMYACCGFIRIARRLFDEMLVRDLVSWNTMVDGYAKEGELDIAHEVFDVMLDKNVVSYNVLITGYLNGENPGVCLKLFREMANCGLRGNETTMVSVLTACGRSARLREGRSLHCFLIKALWDLNLILGTALVDMYSRCRRVDVATLVFDRMLIKNLVCWNAMILGHCLYGNPQDGLKLYESMVGSGLLFGHNEMKLDEGNGLLPDEITFIGILCACARLGHLMEGRSYFKQMVDLYGLKPNFAHYWCMANLFSGAGLVQEAMKILREVSVDKDESPEYLLGAKLLGSCRFEGSVVLGEQIAKDLLELEPENPLGYRLLLNVYAVAGQWDDMAKIKQMMKKTKFKSMVGCSLRDLKEIVHEFNLGDNSLQYLQEIRAANPELAEKMNLS